MTTHNQNLNAVTLFVKVAAKPQSNQKAKEALLADVNGARTEAGNYKMELYKAEGKPDAFYLFERWQDQAALEEHFKQPYTTGAFDLQKADLNEPITMNYLTDLWPLAEGLKKQDHKPLTTLIVTFEVKPGNGDALVALFKEFVPLVRQEPGNVEFHFHSVKGNDNLFVLYERWETQQDLDAHNQLASTARLVQNVSQLVTAPVTDFILFTKDIS
ncbi:hypothetical protein FMM05_02670 [Flavobacterium zepuense]|uniref:ABM domain-containing protein n=1 Tax=Flavobacterium zepuense TaxID=2593302 RepID=A0A552VAQ3_9FLAO|nr:antibiotic biosynthesis monooxygenase [Flavobacterium zepuense]TRW27562.1 hypothetical protein FMM05_02670 [Flavobacterium zepuense]